MGTLLLAKESNGGLVNFRELRKKQYYPRLIGNFPQPVSTLPMHHELPIRFHGVIIVIPNRNFLH
jgi:hypothetical protein